MTQTEAFFDTNILIYFATTKDAKADISEDVMRGGGVVSVQVLNEFVNVTRRKHRMPWLDVSTGLNGIRAICSVVPLTTETHDRGLTVAERYQLSIYDSMIVAAAQLAGCTTLYSEDMQHGLLIDGLRVVDPYRVIPSRR
jgi:predicted nucleic acid-binding protein